MMLRFMYVLLLAAAVSVTQGSQYVTYDVGTLPLVITAPHGGSLNPSSFPERSIDTNAASSAKYCGYKKDGECFYSHQYDRAGGCTSTNYNACKVPYLKDSYTGSIADRLAQKITALTGGKTPHLVKMELKRNKIDANRELAEATFGASNTKAVYDEYAEKIKQAKAAAGPVGLLLDIHGQSHSHGMVELGYTVYGSRLDCGLSCFSLSDTSIRSLITQKCGCGNTACGEAILRGTTSLGHFLADKGYQVVPSPINPGPDGGSYYSGGYTTKVYGSKDGGSFDAIQVEIPRRERFDSSARSAFIDDLASAVVTFMQTHYTI